MKDSNEARSKIRSAVVQYGELCVEYENLVNSEVYKFEAEELDEKIFDKLEEILKLARVII